MGPEGVRVTTSSANGGLRSVNGGVLVTGFWSPHAGGGIPETMTACPESVGRYRIVREIGRGGMGVVYLARDPALDREVAVKTLFQSAWVNQPDTKERFLREARSAARLHHPNIITIHELGEDGGVPFIAMEMLDGMDLANAIRQGRLPRVSDKLRVAGQLCRGLAHAHHQGVIHRDVKPSNIIILDDGTVKVVDFGVAHFDEGTMLTRSGEVLGTPTYMAPEQFTDEPTDHRIDVWAVGVLLYELVAGRRPFEGTTVGSLVYRIVHTQPPKLDPVELEVPPSLVEIINRAMAKNPAARFADLSDLGRCLDRVRAGLEPDFGSDGLDGTLKLPAPLPGEAWREAGIFGETVGLHTMTVSPDGRVLAVGIVDGSIRLWDLGTRMKTVSLRSRLHLRTGHAALTRTIVYSGDGGLLATGHLDGTIYLWQPDSGLELETNLRHEKAVSGLGFTPDGGVLVSGGMDAALKMWDMKAVMEGEARRLLRRQPAPITSLALDAGGRTVVSGHANRSLRVHEIATGRLEATVHGQPSPPSVLAVSPADGMVFTGGRDGDIRRVSLETRRQVGDFEGHARRISSLAVFPDGRRLASVAMDNVLVIWDLESGREITALEGSPGEVFVSVQTVNYGRCLLCGLQDGRIRVWES